MWTRPNSRPGCAGPRRTTRPCRWTPSKASAAAARFMDRLPSILQMKNFDVRLDTSILNESPGQELSGAISPREGIYPRRSEAFEAGATRALSGLSASDAEPIPSPGHLEPLSDNCVPRPTNLSSVDRNGCSRGGHPAAGPAAARSRATCRWVRSRARPVTPEHAAGIPMSRRRRTGSRDHQPASPERLGHRFRDT